MTTRRHLTISVLAPLLAGCVSCASLLTSRGESWEMIQSVGGLRVGDPVRQADGTVFLPVICDVSGLEAITTKPTMVNSALVVRKIATKHREDQIQIRVVTCVVDNRHTSRTEGVELGTLKKGTYQVQYLNPDRTTVRLRDIEVRY